MTTIGGEPFIPWPEPSPTSRLGINLRFYVIGEDAGASSRIDIGVGNERLLERMYFDFNLTARGVTPQTFEETTRAVFQSRLALVTAYGIATTLYVAITTDPTEMSRLARREKRVLASQQRRLPYMTHRQYQALPSTLWGWVQWYVGNLRARLFPSL